MFKILKIVMPFRLIKTGCVYFDANLSKDNCEWLSESSTPITATRDRYKMLFMNSCAIHCDLMFSHIWIWRFCATQWRTFCSDRLNGKFSKISPIIWARWAKLALAAIKSHKMTSMIFILIKSCRLNHIFFSRCKHFPHQTSADFVVYCEICWNRSLLFVFVFFFF